jgi:hypothetical protein
MTYTSRKHYSQAFPKTTAQRDGMTLRDYFAAKAMQGLLASDIECGPDDVASVVASAYILADAMLKARDGHQG